VTLSIVASPDVGEVAHPTHAPAFIMSDWLTQSSGQASPIRLKFEPAMNASLMVWEFRARTPAEIRVHKEVVSAYLGG
jgi:hypothetical protein